MLLFVFVISSMSNCLTNVCDFYPSPSNFFTKHSLQQKVYYHFIKHAPLSLSKKKDCNRYERVFRQEVI